MSLNALVVYSDANRVSRDVYHGNKMKITECRLLRSQLGSPLLLLESNLCGYKWLPTRQANIVCDQASLNEDDLLPNALASVAEPRRFGSLSSNMWS